MSYHAQQVLKYRVLISFKNAIVGEEEKKGASFFLPLQHFLSPKNVYFSPSMPATQQAIRFFVLKKKNASTLLDFLLHLFSSHFGIFLESNFKVLSPEREREGFAGIVHILPALSTPLTYLHRNHERTLCLQLLLVNHHYNPLLAFVTFHPDLMEILALYPRSPEIGIG